MFCNTQSLSLASPPRVQMWKVGQCYKCPHSFHICNILLLHLPSMARKPLGLQSVRSVCTLLWGQYQRQALIPWAGCGGLGQLMGMEIILTLYAPFLDNMCKILGRWGMLLTDMLLTDWLTQTRLWIFHPTLLAGSFVKYGGFRDLGLPSNWLVDTGGHLASQAPSFSLMWDEWGVPLKILAAPSSILIMSRLQA